MTVPTPSSLNPGEYPRTGGPRAAAGVTWYIGFIAPLLLGIGLPMLSSRVGDWAWRSFVRLEYASPIASLLPMMGIGVAAGFVVYGVVAGVSATRHRQASSLGAVFLGIGVGVISAVVMWNQFWWDVLIQPFAIATVWGLGAGVYLLALFRAGRPGIRAQSGFGASPYGSTVSTVGYGPSSTAPAPTSTPHGGSDRRQEPPWGQQQYGQQYGQQHGGWGGQQPYPPHDPQQR